MFYSWEDLKQLACKLNHSYGKYRLFMLDSCTTFKLLLLFLLLNFFSSSLLTFISYNFTFHIFAVKKGQGRSLGTKE